jgi:hypothetical protein
MKPLSISKPLKVRRKDTDSDAGSIVLPKASFASYAAEGDILAKQGDYRKAVEIYTKVSILLV